jgi:integrase
VILGRGTAESDREIVDEYRRFLDETRRRTELSRDLKAAAAAMCHRMGKPIRAWTDDEILALYAGARKATRYRYTAFLAFLLFRGYRRASLDLLVPLRLSLALQHPAALEPCRRRIDDARRQLGYQVDGNAASDVHLLNWLLTVVHKPLEELSRADFERFREEYVAWYQGETHRSGAGPDPRLARLENYLVQCWRILPPRARVFDHEAYFAAVRHAPIRAAILSYLRFSGVKHRAATVEHRRPPLRNLVLWLQEHHPSVARLDGVTRAIALSYAEHLKEQGAQGRISPAYVSGQYGCVRAFFSFAIDERLDTSPDRNPFGAGDLPREPDRVLRYLEDREVRALLAYCERGSSLKERTMIVTLLHTGVRAAEFCALKASDIVQIQGAWKLHVREGKGLKDRVIPLTPQCLAALRAWQEAGWTRTNDHLFTFYGRPYRENQFVTKAIRRVGLKLGIVGLTPHRFRHTFAVALINYGLRESALQKLMGHATLTMTLEYGRILDKSVEHAFNHAIEQMRVGPLSWVPSFLGQEEYTLFAEGDALRYIRLPHGYCRRNPKLHCESDVKCLLCDRYTATPTDLPPLREMHERFTSLGLQLKADVVAAQIRRLEGQPARDVIPLRVISAMPR